MIRRVAIAAICRGASRKEKRAREQGGESEESQVDSSEETCRFHFVLLSY